MLKEVDQTEGKRTPGGILNAQEVMKSVRDGK